MFPTRFPHWPWRQHLITLFYPLSLTYLKPDSRLVWVNRKLSALFTLSKLYSSLVIFMSQRLVSLPSAEGNEPQWKRVIICLCIGVHMAAWKKRGKEEKWNSSQKVGERNKNKRLINFPVIAFRSAQQTQTWMSHHFQSQSLSSLCCFWCVISLLVAEEVKNIKTNGNKSYNKRPIKSLF